MCLSAVTVTNTRGHYFLLDVEHTQACTRLEKELKFADCILTFQATQQMSGLLFINLRDDIR